MGPVYVSTEGAKELAALRVGRVPAATGGAAPIELLARVPSEECGCPEELWRYEGLIVLLHLEREKGTGEFFVWAGDWESEASLPAHSLAHLRAQVFARLADVVEPG